MELILDIATLAVSVFLFGYTYTFRTIAVASGGGAAFWPRILLGVIILLEIALIFFTAIKFKNGELKKERDPGRINPQNLYIGIGSMFAYIVLMNYVGFLISTVLFLLFLMYILKVPPLRNILTSVVGAYLIAIVFVSLLLVPLPEGVSIFRIISSTFGL